MVDSLRTFKGASLFVHGYHWLPIATIRGGGLVGMIIGGTFEVGGTILRYRRGFTTIDF